MREEQIHSSKARRLAKHPVLNLGPKPGYRYFKLIGEAMRQLTNILTTHGNGYQRAALGIGTIIGPVLGMVFGQSMIGGAISLVGMTVLGASVGAAVGLKW